MCCVLCCVLCTAQHTTLLLVFMSYPAYPSPRSPGTRSQDSKESWDLVPGLQVLTPNPDRVGVGRGKPAGPGSGGTRPDPGPGGLPRPTPTSLPRLGLGVRTGIAKPAGLAIPGIRHPTRFAKPAGLAIPPDRLVRQVCQNQAILGLAPYPGLPGLTDSGRPAEPVDLGTSQPRGWEVQELSTFQGTPGNA